MKLAYDEVHVWVLPLDEEPTGDALDVLSREERWRASRFRFARDRRRFLAAHLALRQALAPYVDIAPDQLRFARGEWGKPQLAGADGVQFNLSHSGDTAVLAVAASLPIGVDLERLRPMPSCQELARAYFAPGERRALGKVRDELREQAFLRLWTRKEALVKGAGMGLELPLDSFEVPLDPDEADVVLPEAGAWSVRTANLASGHVASVATPGRAPAWSMRQAG